MRAFLILALLTASVSAAGCGGSGRTTAGRPQYTLGQVKTTFAAHGFTLQELSADRGLVVLADLHRAGAFGYQHVGDHPSGTQLMVFVGTGHSESEGNVWVGYGTGERRNVRAAPHHLALTAQR